MKEARVCLISVASPLSNISFLLRCLGMESGGKTAFFLPSHVQLLFLVVLTSPSLFPHSILLPRLLSLLLFSLSISFRQDYTRFTARRP